MKNRAQTLGRLAQWQNSGERVRQADAAQLRGDWSEAARLYEIVIAQSPHRADLLTQLGHCNKERGAYSRSYANYLRAIALNPTDDDAYLHLGHLLKVTGNIFCGSRCYIASAILGNSDAQSEYNNIKAIAKPPRYTLRKTVGENPTVEQDSDRNVRQLNLLLGMLEMCEVDLSVVSPLQEAAQLLFLAGFSAAAKSLFEMSFIREGFGSIARRNSIEVASRTNLWHDGGPLLWSSRVSSSFRRPFPATRRAALGWLIEEFTEARADAPIPTWGSGAAKPDWSERVSLDFNVLAGHAIISPPQAAAVRALVARVYQTLAAANADDDPCDRLGAVMRDLKVSVADAVPLISFDTDDIRVNVELHAARVLFNNLHDFVAENLPIIVGDLASPRVLAGISRFEYPLLAPYLTKAARLFDSPGELVDDIAYEIIRSGDHCGDQARRRAFEQVVALVGCRLDGDALIQLCAALLDSNLPDAAAAVLHSLLRQRNDLNLLGRLSQTIKQLGFFELARAILRNIPQHRCVKAGSIQFGMLVEQGILEKICGNFDEAVAIFQKCLAIDQQNQFLKQEILTLLPEIEDIDEVVERIRMDPDFRELAEQRQLYRLHLDGHTLYRAKTGECSEVREDELVPELAGSLRTSYSGEEPEAVAILHLGSERHRSQWGALPILRGVEAVRVRVISQVELIAMRVRFDGRTVCVEWVRAAARQSSQNHEYVFNAWFDASALRIGLHQLQLYFEEKSGGYRIREELVLVDQPLAHDAHVHRSGSMVVLDEATAALSVDERVNSLPSVIYSAQRCCWEAPIRRVLVVRADQLGDFVISMPAIKRLRSLFRDARFFGLVSSAALEMARTSGLFDELFEIDLRYDPLEGRRYLSLQDQIQLQRRLRKHSFDLAVDLTMGSDTRPLLRLSGALITVGFKPHEFPWLSFGIDAVTRDAVNGSERVAHGTLIMMLIDALGTIFRSESTVAPVRYTDWQMLGRFGIAEGEHYLLLHSGARLHIKRWPLTHYLELARLAIELTDFRVVLLVDYSSLLPEVEEAGLRADRLCVIAGPLPFAELNALVSHCAVMVGNDSGPKHLAVARGAKVVSVHMGQVNWQEWGQEGDGLIVTRHVPCYACGIVAAQECGKDLACLVLIQPEEVLAAVQQILAAGVAREPAKLAFQDRQAGGGARSLA